jgi:3D (Asp-Asp-Asp) domain-containing protein
VLGQAHAPRRRTFAIAVAASGVLALPAVSGAEPPRSGSSGAALTAENAALESRERSAVLGLYALDTQLARERERLAELERQAARLRQEQVILAAEMKIAIAGQRISQHQLASRVRLLFHNGDTSTLEIIFGATSLEEAIVELDSLKHVTSINNDVLEQLGRAKARTDRASRALAARAARLAAATRAQEETTRALAAARADRAAYIDELRRRHELNSQQIAQIESQAQAAGVKTRQLVAVSAGAPASAPAATPAVVSIEGKRTLTVDAVAYSLPGRTASGLPVGWGVVAVDPSVIPLGTRMFVPGYGEAIAADTGTAIKGGIIDLWFPTTAMARAWGRRSVTITLD